MNTGPLSGSIEGAAITDMSATFMQNSSGILVVLISNASDTCDYASGGNINVPYATTLELDITRNAPTLSPGTYAVGAAQPNQVAITAQGHSNDGSCNDRLIFDTGALATSGSVTITSATATEIDGSVNIPFMTGTVKGTFSATLCQQDGGAQTMCPM